MLNKLLPETNHPFALGIALMLTIAAISFTEGWIIMYMWRDKSFPVWAKLFVTTFGFLLVYGLIYSLVHQ